MTPFRVLLFLLLVFAPAALAQTAPRPLKQISGPAHFSPDARLLVHYTQQQLHFVRHDNQQLLQRIPSVRSLHPSHFNADGRFVAVSESPDRISVWQTQPFVRRAQIHEALPVGQRQFSFALSPDAMYLTLARLEPLGANYLNLYLHVWDLARQRRLQRLFVTRLENVMPGHTPDVSLAYHPLGGYLSVAVESMPQSQQPPLLMVRDLQQHQWLYWLPGSSPLSYSGNGKYFAFSVPGPQHAQVRLWHTPSNLLKTVPLSAAAPPAPLLALSARGRWLAFARPATVGQQELQVLRVRDLKPVLSVALQSGADTFSFHRNERQLLVSSQANPDFLPLLYTLPQE